MGRLLFDVSTAPWPAVFLGLLWLFRWLAAPSLVALRRVRRSFGQIDSPARAAPWIRCHFPALDLFVGAARLAGLVGRLSFASRSDPIESLAGLDPAIPRHLCLASRYFECLWIRLSHRPAGRFGCSPAVAAVQAGVSPDRS